jgi:hypothetical protein
MEVAMAYVDLHPAANVQNYWDPHGFLDRVERMLRPKDTPPKWKARGIPPRRCN